MKENRGKTVFFWTPPRPCSAQLGRSSEINGRQFCKVLPNRAGVPAIGRAYFAVQKQKRPARWDCGPGPFANNLPRYAHQMRPLEWENVPLC